jgi:hypothetical protein
MPKFMFEMKATTNSKDILQKIMQHIQTFNAMYNDDIHFEMFCSSDPIMSEKEVCELFDSLVPKLPYRKVIRTSEA